MYHIDSIRIDTFGNDIQFNMYEHRGYSRNGFFYMRSLVRIKTKSWKYWMKYSRSTCGHFPRHKLTDVIKFWDQVRCTI
jgi:hypothetical protein